MLETGWLRGDILHFPITCTLIFGIIFPNYFPRMILVGVPWRVLGDATSDCQAGYSHSKDYVSVPCTLPFSVCLS